MNLNKLPDQISHMDISRLDTRTVPCCVNLDVLLSINCVVVTGTFSFIRRGSQILAWAIMSLCIDQENLSPSR